MLTLLKMLLVFLWRGFENIVALAVGFVEGLGWGDNAKAAIMRVGLLETIKFSETFSHNLKLILLLLNLLV